LPTAGRDAPEPSGRHVSRRSARLHSLIGRSGEDVADLLQRATKPVAAGEVDSARLGDISKAISPPALMPKSPVRVIDVPPPIADNASGAFRARTPGGQHERNREESESCHPRGRACGCAAA